MLQTSMGIDIGGTKMLMLAEVDGQMVTKTVATGVEFGSINVKKELHQFVQELHIVVLNMGVAIPGLVNQAGQVVTCDVLPKIQGMDPNFLRIDNRDQQEIYFINDAEAALMEETSDLTANSTAVIIMVGTGIGMALKANGNTLKGCKGWAGELGSIPIATLDGAEKLDALAAGASILFNTGMSFAAIQEKLAEDDLQVKQIIKKAGAYFRLGIATVINIVNPELMILGGGTLNYDGYYQSALESAHKLTLPDLWNACTIRKPKEEKRVVALGAMRFAKIQSNPNAS
jgi:predicted NBD/HSP70 family sugar kinase